jgi:hypothetical protein
VPEGRIARELKAGAALGLPHYRITMTGRVGWDQHRYLLELDRHPNIDLYAAPMISSEGRVRRGVPVGAGPRPILLCRAARHWCLRRRQGPSVSFDGVTYYQMSEPEEIEGLGLVELEAALSRRLNGDERPLRATLREALVEAAIERSRRRGSLQGDLPGSSTGRCPEK